MRAVVRSLFVFAAIALGAATSSAAVLPFAGSLSFTISILPPITVTGTGVATTGGLGSHLSTLALPASPFAGTGDRLVITTPVAAPISGIQLTVHNGAGTIMGGGGPIPLLGVAKVCLFAPCSGTPVANVSVPLSAVGVGGVVALNNGLVSVTAFGAPWTVGTAAVGTVTQMGFAHGPASLASSTAAASGAIGLVTPVFVSTNIGSSAVIPAFGVMTLHFVPEPGTMLLLGAGFSALALAGRRRMHGAG